MRRWQSIGISLVAAACIAGPGVRPASAQTDAQALKQQIDQLRQDFETLKQQYGDRLTTLEARLAVIQGGSTAGTAPAPSAQAYQQPAAPSPQQPPAPAPQ